MEFYTLIGGVVIVEYGGTNGGASGAIFGLLPHCVSLAGSTERSCMEIPGNFCVVGCCFGEV